MSPPAGRLDATPFPSPPRAVRAVISKEFHGSLCPSSGLLPSERSGCETRDPPRDAAPCKTESESDPWAIEARLLRNCDAAAQEWSPHLCQALVVDCPLTRRCMTRLDQFLRCASIRRSSLLSGGRLFSRALRTPPAKCSARLSHEELRSCSCGSSGAS